MVNYKFSCQSSPLIARKINKIQFIIYLLTFLKSFLPCHFTLNK